ncbi:GNAT family N-acetyltransferase [Acidithiobacillus thiooxidans]|uniref:GCN5 family acetyltransferase n=1 Tax=Acidithiobacillus thiooxidans TaxID=930 RepID=A0A1C2I557_ACITH|nr:GNAT family protein [Acidithiobacillus thiooxidans]OCX71047.1 GCN5 family acetyltransferase [Acidithiobacillus thiooxidans]OCX83353.1 GCN5 family acetyltransferase [Acidithiobacillus thiooxidans]
MGEEVIIRKVKVEDAQSVLSLMYKLDRESKFMLLEPEERTTTLEQQIQIIQSYKDSQNKVMYVLTNDDKALGFVDGIGNTANRNKHCMSLVIGLVQAISGQGFGKKLLNNLEGWAIPHGYSRLELTVMQHNERAKRLYESCGFKVEGLKRNSLVIDGKYVDELYMAKLLIG